MRRINTPNVRLSVVMLTFLAYLTLPVVYSAWMSRMQEQGAFPVTADSIGIPIAVFVILWLFCIPLLIIGFGIFEMVGRSLAAE